MPVYRLSSDLIFPHPQNARKDGLLAVGGDLSPERLVKAYEMGIFPWYSEGEPILWWSPDPRMVLFPKKVKINHGLKRTLKSGKYTVTFNKDFPSVIEKCRSIRLEKGEDTWITADMKKSYIKLHEWGYAHSVETWYGEKLVGGLYGVAIGSCFCGESMFSLMADASKVALVALAGKMTEISDAMIDCQVPSAHLASMGAEIISRKDFLVALKKASRNIESIVRVLRGTPNG